MAGSGKWIKAGKKRARDASIQKKLTFSTWLVAIIPIMAIFAIVFFVFLNTNVENSKRQSQLILDKTVGELDGYFSQAEEAMNSLVTDINVQNAIVSYDQGTYKERLDLRDYIRNRLANVSGINRLAVNTSLYIKGTKKTFSKDFMDKELYGAYGREQWFQDLLDGKSSMCQRQGPSLADGRPAYLLASNIVSVRDGSVLGLAYMELDQDRLEEKFRELVAEGGGAILAGQVWIPSKNYGDRMKYVSVYSYSAALGQEVEYRLQMKELRRGYEVALFYFMAGMAVLVLLIYGMDKLLADWFARRIIRLRDATREIAQGNLEVEVEDAHGDEIGELGASLNQMARDMKRLIENEYLVKIENQQATLQALQSQINPHFVYNTLESISMLALIHDNYDIVDMAQAFSSMMRYSMQEAALATVEEEVVNVRNFVTIQKIRFPGRFQVLYHIDARCIKKKVLRLSMQPLVENAFKHGFEDLPAHRKLVVSVRERRGRLVICIFNDGLAISRQRIARIRQLLRPDNQEDTMDCFALRNLCRRLRLKFGQEGRFTIRSKEGVGILAVMSLPVSE